MMDPAHRETEELLTYLERDIQDIYAQAARETQAKLEDYLERFEKKDATWQQWVKDGKKTPQEYQQWRTGQMAMGERWAEMRDSLAQDMTNAHEIAKSIVAGYQTDVYALNHN